MKEKPRIFKPEVRNVNNNSKVYYSFLNDKLNIEPEYERDNINETPLDFINKLNKSGTYIFNKQVIIKTKDKVYDTKIAGKLGNRIVTLDNDSINIEDIKEIYEK